MTTVETIMTEQVVTVEMDDPLSKIQDLFKAKPFHHLLVIDSAGALVGVVSDRDCIKAMSPFVGTASERTRDARTLKKRVHQVMTYFPTTVEPTTTIEKAGRIMLEKSISCLPVLDDDKAIVGIVTIKDVLGYYLDHAIAIN